MAACGAVFHAFWYGIRLFPQNIASQIPTIRSQRKGEHPRDTQQVLRLGVLAGDGLFQAPHDSTRVGALLRVLPAGIRMTPVRVATLSASGVAVGNVDPQRAIRLQDSLHLMENLYQLRNKLLRRVFQPYLSVNSVVSELEIRRRRDAALHALAIQLSQDCKRVTAVYQKTRLPDCNLRMKFQV